MKAIPGGTKSKMTENDGFFLHLTPKEREVFRCKAKVWCAILKKTEDAAPRGGVLILRSISKFWILLKRRDGYEGILSHQGSRAGA